VRTWAAAWDDALYGPAGFYARGRGAGPDFRTPASADPDGLARSLLRHLPAPGAVTDVGAGRGHLLAALARLLPEEVPLLGVDPGPRPADLPERVAWRSGLPDALEGLVVAVELLDVVPCTVVAAGRVVLVGADGTETLDGPPDPRDAAWLDTWWPSWRAGERAEVGRPRDELWRDVTRRLKAGGVAVAVDYGHHRPQRPDGGTLTGFRGGRQVVPVPDGSMDLTAHVALDSVAAAVGAAVTASPLAGWPRHRQIVLDTCP
jgi:SAM-dependent MidA family methyltransferase